MEFFFLVSCPNVWRADSSSSSWLCFVLLVFCSRSRPCLAAQSRNESVFQSNMACVLERARRKIWMSTERKNPENIQIWWKICSSLVQNAPVSIKINLFRCLRRDSCLFSDMERFSLQRPSWTRRPTSVKVRKTISFLIFRFIFSRFIKNIGDKT